MIEKIKLNNSLEYCQKHGVEITNWEKGKTPVWAIFFLGRNFGSRN